MDCPACGMHVDDGEQVCPKCDTHVFAGNRRRTLHADLAHDGQSVEQSLRQLDELMLRAQRERYGRVRLVTGDGRIRRAVDERLLLRRNSWQIRRYGSDGRNVGALLVELE